MIGSNAPFLELMAIFNMVAWHNTSMLCKTNIVCQREFKIGLRTFIVLTLLY